MFGRRSGALESDTADDVGDERTAVWDAPSDASSPVAAPSSPRVPAPAATIRGGSYVPRPRVFAPVDVDEPDYDPYAGSTKVMSAAQSSAAMAAVPALSAVHRVERLPSGLASSERTVVMPMTPMGPMTPMRAAAPMIANAPQARRDAGSPRAVTPVEIACAVLAVVVVGVTAAFVFLHFT